MKQLNPKDVGVVPLTVINAFERLRSECHLFANFDSDDMLMMDALVIKC